MPKKDDPDEPKQRSFSARVAAVQGFRAQCKTVSVVLDVENDRYKIRRAVLIGTEGRRNSSGLIVEDREERVRAHIYFDARALRHLTPGTHVQIDWVPVGDDLMTNIALTVTARPDRHDHKAILNG